MGEKTTRVHARVDSSSTIVCRHSMFKSEHLVGLNCGGRDGRGLFLSVSPCGERSHKCVS
jgi:hypothetical protein